MQRQKIQWEKYKQVILYLLKRGANNPWLGKVKLFKLLYYCDFDHYQAFDSPITGDTYRKRPYGPVGEHAEKILLEMRDQELITIGTKTVGDFTQYVFDARIEPEPDKLSISEREILDHVISKWASHRTGEIVTATHGEAPWRAVEMGQEIPYSLAYYRHQVYEYSAPNDEEDIDPTLDLPF